VVPKTQSQRTTEAETHPSSQEPLTIQSKPTMLKKASSSHLVVGPYSTWSLTTRTSLQWLFNLKLQTAVDTIHKSACMGKKANNLCMHKSNKSKQVSV